jgi:hypothetical protein
MPRVRRFFMCKMFTVCSESSRGGGSMTSVADVQIPLRGNGRLCHLPLKVIRVGNRHRRRDLALSSLIESIKELGLLQPIVVDFASSTLIAGERRLGACRALGWDEIPCHLVNIDQIARGEYAENVERLNFTLTELVAIKRTLEPALRDAAKERMVAAHASCGKFPELASGRTRDMAAVGLGVSGRTLEKAEAVVSAAEAEPEKYSKLLADMDRTGRVDGPYKPFEERATGRGDQVRAASIAEWRTVSCHCRRSPLAI